MRGVHVAQGPVGHFSLVWLILNLLRLAGLIAIAWTAVSQLQLMADDIQAVKQPPATTSSSSSTAPSASPAFEAASSPTTSSSDAPTSTTSSSDSSNQPLVIFPTGAIARRALPEPGKSLFLEDEASSTIDDTDDGRYYMGSTVPKYKGGSAFAILATLATVSLLIVLFMGQLGLPEIYMLDHLGALSINSSPLILGSGQVYLGLMLNRHYVDKIYRIPPIAMLVIGVINILIATILIFIHTRKRRGQTSTDLTTYQRFHLTQRVMFWRPLPSVGRDPKSRNTATFQMVKEDRDPFAGSEDGSEGHHSRRGSEEDGWEGKEYPTFAGTGIEDPEKQVPSMTIDMDGARWEPRQRERTLNAITEESESDEEGGFQLSKSPSPKIRQAPPSGLGTYSAPHRVNSVQAKVGLSAPTPPIPTFNEENTVLGGGYRTRFAAEDIEDLPEINVVSPTTIASSRGGSVAGSVRHTRPFSQSSVGSGSSAQFIHQVAPHFPVPPANVNPHSQPTFPPRAKAKPHLVNPNFDQSRLIPRKSAVAPKTRHSVGPRPVRGRTVRFEIEPRNSVDSVSSVSSASSMLSSFLPPKGKGQRPRSAEVMSKVGSGSDTAKGMNLSGVLVSRPVTQQQERRDSGSSLSDYGAPEAFIQPTRKDSSSSIYHDAPERLSTSSINFSAPSTQKFVRAPPKSAVTPLSEDEMESYFQARTTHQEV